MVCCECGDEVVAVVIVLYLGYYLRDSYALEHVQGWVWEKRGTHGLIPDIQPLVVP